MKTELFHDLPTPAACEDARFAVQEYIEVFYNRRRRHSSLNYLTPAEFGARYHDQAAEPAA